MTSKEEEIIQLKQRICELEAKLKKYTNGNNHKTYYEKNKEIVMKKANENKKKLKETNPEKIKEYAHRAYLKRKEKIQKMKEEEDIIDK
jgi:predicted MPP superfamily phosphohydrolase